MTDLPHVLQHAQTNLGLNREAVASARGSVSTAPLEWGSLEGREEGRRWLGINTASWTSLDMLLGADLVYSEQQVRLTRATYVKHVHSAAKTAQLRAHVPQGSHQRAVSQRMLLVFCIVQVAPLIKTLAALLPLMAPGSAALLAHKHRSDAVDALLLAALAEAGVKTTAVERQGDLWEKDSSRFKNLSIYRLSLEG
jgi:hypothetical protein